MQRSPLDLDRLRVSLGPEWTQVELVERTESTNADLLAADGVSDHAVRVAELQVSGRGRFDRVWSSPARAGLTFSVLLRPSAPLQAWGWLPLLAGVALDEAVRERTGVSSGLKWPNDLIVRADGRKLAGILAQTSGAVAVIGVGLNVDTTQEELPVPSAASLRLAGAHDLDRTGLLVAILARLQGWYQRWSDCGGQAQASGLRSAYKAACLTLDMPVRVSVGGRTGSVVEGLAADVDEHGRLVVRTESGPRVVAAGDVEHVRPA